MARKKTKTRKEPTAAAIKKYGYVRAKIRANKSGSATRKNPFRDEMREKYGANWIQDPEALAEFKAGHKMGYREDTPSQRKRIFIDAILAAEKAVLGLSSADDPQVRAVRAAIDQDKAELASLFPGSPEAQKKRVKAVLKRERMKQYRGRGMSVGYALKWSGVAPLSDAEMSQIKESIREKRGGYWLKGRKGRK